MVRSFPQIYTGRVPSYTFEAVQGAGSKLTDRVSAFASIGTKLVVAQAQRHGTIDADPEFTHTCLMKCVGLL